MRTLALACTLCCFVAAVSEGALYAQTSAPEPGRASPRAGTRATAPMTNADVVKMVKAGLGDAVVTASIRGAKKTIFDVSPDGLVDLKTAGVSDSVIAVMLDPAAAVPVATTAPAAVAVVATPPIDPNDPLSPHDAGIYMDVGTGAPRLVALESTSFKQGKSGGLLGSALTMGIKKMKWKAIVRTPRAAQRTSNGSTPFYFYFEKKSSIEGDATNPSEFVLARMKQKGDQRELIVGEAGALGASSGTREKDTVEFRAEKLAPGVYKVTPVENLNQGEYCFFLAAGSASPGQVGATGHLFDFGVDS